MLGDHDGIIDHNAEADDQRKERDHVERETKHVHQRDGRGHSDGNAGCNPERRAGRKEKKQERQHDEKSTRPVAHQNAEPVTDSGGPGPRQDHLDIFG